MHERNFTILLSSRGGGGGGEGVNRPTDVCYSHTRFGTQKLGFRTKALPKKIFLQDFTLAISTRKTEENCYCCVSRIVFRPFFNF